MALAYNLYLLDIEGTVAPLALVTDQLFPYARAHFAEFLQKNAGNPAVAADLTLLVEENHAETDPGVPHLGCHPERVRRGGRVEGSAFRDDGQPLIQGAPEPALSLSKGLVFEAWESTNTTLAYLLWLMDRDRKSTALKSLQGKIWKAGFESGELKGTLFADVPDALARWAAESKVAIYSSGSVEAQQLLFRYSNYGDLTPHISAYFDTRIGPKKESASYAAIATAMGVAPCEAIFFSDIVAELDAAREAGFATRLMIREGNTPVEDTRGHITIGSFDSL